MIVALGVFAITFVLIAARRFSLLRGEPRAVGPMANLIVADLSRGLYPIGFREYFRYGVVITAVTTVVGVAYLWVFLPRSGREKSLEGSWLASCASC